MRLKFKNFLVSLISALFLCSVGINSSSASSGLLDLEKELVGTTINIQTSQIAFDNLVSKIKPKLAKKNLLGKAEYKQQEALELFWTIGYTLFAEGYRGTGENIYLVSDIFKNKYFDCSTASLLYLEIFKALEIKVPVSLIEVHTNSAMDHEMLRITTQDEPKLFYWETNMDHPFADPVSLSEYRTVVINNKKRISDAENSFEDPAAIKSIHMATIAAYLVTQGRTQEAKTILDKALIIYPTNYIAMKDRAVLYSTENNLVESNRLLNQAIGIFPRYATAYYDRGLIYVKSYVNKGSVEDLDNAISDFKRAVEIKEEYVAAQKNLDVAIYMKSQVGQGKKYILNFEGQYSN